jgi:hypothetical protein
MGIIKEIVEFPDGLIVTPNFRRGDFLNVFLINGFAFSGQDLVSVDIATKLCHQEFDFLLILRS